MLNLKGLTKRIARTIHLIAGGIITSLGFCPYCLNEVLSGGNSCPICFSSFKQIGRRYVFYQWKNLFENVLKDAQLYCCPSCGSSWSADNFLYAKRGKVECPVCHKQLPSITHNTYIYIITSCNRCEAPHAGAIPAAVEWIRCRNCEDYIPTPAPPLSKEESKAT